MNATHYDHQHDWWQYAECEECSYAGAEEYDSLLFPHLSLSQNGKHCGLQMRHMFGKSSDVSGLMRFLRCHYCNAFYISIERFDTVPVLYRLGRETDFEATVSSMLWHGVLR